MCDFCPDDESDITTHRDRISYWEHRIRVGAANIAQARQELERARKDLKYKLRKGEIRNA